MGKPAPFQVNQVRVVARRGPRQEDGRWYWRARVAEGGDRRDVWAGWATREEAGAAVLAVLSDRAEPAPELRTMRDVLECWVAAVLERADVAPRTQLACKGGAVRLLAHGLGDVAVVTVTRPHLEQHRDKALRAGAAPAAVARDLKYLRQAWAWARDAGAIPARDLPRVSVQRAAPVYSRYTPTTDDVLQLLDGVSERVRRALVLLAATGCRVGEVVGLTWSQVPLDAARLRVRGKTGERWVALHPAVAAEVRTWERGAPGERVVPLATNTIRVALADRAAELGLPRVSPNGLRRHVVDALYRTGRIDAAASQLGHSAATALSVYRQVTDADRSAAIDAADLAVVVALPQKRRKEQ